MKLLSRVLAFVIIAALTMLSAGCGSTASGTEGQYIIEAKAVPGFISQGNTVVVDTQKPEDYDAGHLKGAVNISREDIVINKPVENMLAPKEKIEAVLGNNGISNDTLVIVYDNNNNMDAARFWWTLVVYGHEKVKVVSGGIKALQAAKLELSTEKASVTPVKYSAKDKNNNMIATIDEVKAQVDDPKKGFILLDTRNQEEFNQGTIPGSVLIDYAENNYKDGTYKSIQDIKIQYIENKITPDKTVIMYCKTSIRAAQTYLALYNAGYRSLKLYDGAWLEWSADKSLPSQTPSENKVESNQKDNS